LKYLALMFDRLLLPHPADEGVINAREERFLHASGREFVQGSVFAPFLRSPDYSEAFALLRERLSPIEHRGVVAILPHRENDQRTVSARREAYESAIANSAVVEAAIPDRDTVAPSFQLPSGIYYGMQVRPEGTANTSPKPHEVPSLPREWSEAAWLRVGAALKYLRVAHTLNATPVGFDRPNIQILHHLAISSSSFVPELAAGEFGFAESVMDPERLEAHLNGMTWKDVLETRKLLLPRVAGLRKLVEQRNAQINRFRHDRSPQFLRDEVRKLWLEFEALEKKQADDLSKVTAGLQLEMIAAAILAYGSSIVLPGSWPAIFAVLIGASIKKGEVRDYVLSRKAKRNHIMYPFFFLERKGSVP